MQQRTTTAPIRPIAPHVRDDEPAAVRITGIDLAFGDVFNVAILVMAAQLVIAAIVGAFALLVWAAFSL